MQQQTATLLTHENSAFFRLIRHPVKFRLYLLKNLPSAYFSGLRVVEADANHCIVSVPFKWFTQNPFRSIYFACLSMAAELSTGVLAMAQVYGRKPRVAMLVVGVEAKFYKKAVGKTFFQCKNGGEITAAVAEAVACGVAQEVQAHSVGRNEAGETVAEFWFRWSFKAKS